MKDTREIIVLDTNIIVDNWECYKGFGDAIVVVPSVVMDELDGFKTRMDSVGYNARRFTKVAEKFTRPNDDGIGQSLATKGVKIGEGGKLFISHTYDLRGKDPLRYPLEIGEPDKKIVRCGLVWQACNPDMKVTVLSHDQALKLLARNNGVRADSRTVEDVVLDDIPSTIRTYTSDEMVAHIVQEIKGAQSAAKAGFQIEAETAERIAGLDLNGAFHNQYFHFVVDGESGRDWMRTVYRYDKISKRLVPMAIKPHESYAGVKPRNLEQAILMDAIMNNETDVVAAFGKAGTGKTLCLLACALERINRSRTDEEDDEAVLYITKPQINVAGEEYGFLPGDITAKVRLGYKGVATNIRQIMKWWGQLRGQNGSLGKQMAEDYGRSLDELQANGIVELYPLGHIRGDTILRNEILIVDEAQNTTPATMRDILSRGQDGCKILLSGDSYQIDNPHTRKGFNGLAHAVQVITSGVMPSKYASSFAAVELLISERGKLAEAASR